MRILYLNHNVAGTGTYQRAFHLAAAMVERGHDVTLVTTSRDRRGRGQERAARGVRIIEAPDLLAGGARNGWDLWNAAWRGRRLRGEECDLIHAFDCRPVVILPALVQRQRTGAPLFLDWADWWGRGGTIMERSGPAVRTLIGPVETWLEESFRQGATANTTISELLRERCVMLGVPRERVLALPNGCEPPVAHVGREAARGRLELGSGPVVLHVGMMHRPDSVFLMDSLRRLLKRRPDVRLVLVGRSHAVVPQDLEHAVVRTGFVSDAVLRDWLAAADCGVIPLRDTIASRGRWPGKINDYLTAGLPPVLPRVGAAAGYVERAGAGIVCDATPAALADALDDALGGDRTDMAEAARELAGGELAWTRIADALESFYLQWAPPARRVLQENLNRTQVLQ